jgi:hypothetical protein
MTMRRASVAFLFLLACRSNGETPPHDAAVVEVKEAAAPPPPPPPPPRTYDIHHVLGTGQSLSVGTVGVPALTTTQPFTNLMFDGGVIPEKDLGSFVPLAEGDLIPGSMMRVETHSAGFANLVTQLAGGKYTILVSQHGIGGEPYSALKKGGTREAYANGIAQATAGRDVAAALGKSYVVTAITNVHGETDHMIGNANYTHDLLEWQSDYDTDVRALTKQSEPIPMFESQISNWTKFGTPTSAIPAQQLAAHVQAPGKIVLVGAKYHLPYVSDGIHLTNQGYRHMGEDYAKAYKRTILDGAPWEPLRPKTVTRSGDVITIVFHVPSPPLVFDTKLVTDPGKMGFEYADDSGAAAPKIASVAIAGAHTVKVTLSAAPTAANGRIRYAFTGTPGAAAGPTTGPRGNLRDSDPTPSRGGYPLYNWCIHFDEPVQ